MLISYVKLDLALYSNKDGSHPHALIICYMENEVTFTAIQRYTYSYKCTLDGTLYVIYTKYLSKRANFDPTYVHVSMFTFHNQYLG